MKKILVLLIWVYQRTISPYFGNCCRFYPTCSDYAIDAIKKKGALLGMLLAFKRIAKCGPWHSGGIDEIS